MSCHAGGGRGANGMLDVDHDRRGRGRRDRRDRRDTEREREREHEREQDELNSFTSRYQTLDEVLGQVRAPCNPDDFPLFFTSGIDSRQQLASSSQHGKVISCEHSRLHLQIIQLCCSALGHFIGSRVVSVNATHFLHLMPL